MYADRRTTCSLPAPRDFGAEEGSFPNAFGEGWGEGANIPHREPRPETGEVS